MYRKVSAVREKRHGVWSGTDWIQFSAWALNICVELRKLPNLSKLPFSHLQKGFIELRCVEGS